LQRLSHFCSDDVLFPGSGSGVVADTLATFVTVFCVLTCTVAVTLAPLPSGLVKVQSIAVPELATVQLPAIAATLAAAGVSAFFGRGGIATVSRPVLVD